MNPQSLLQREDIADFNATEVKAFLSSLDIPDHEVLVIWIAFRVGIFVSFRNFFSIMMIYGFLQVMISGLAIDHVHGSWNSIMKNMSPLSKCMHKVRQVYAIASLSSWEDRA